MNNFQKELRRMDNKFDKVKFNEKVNQLDKVKVNEKINENQHDLKLNGKNSSENQHDLKLNGKNSTFPSAAMTDLKVSKGPVDKVHLKNQDDIEIIVTQADFQKFCPIFYFHPKEQWFPAPFEWIVRHSKYLYPEGDNLKRVERPSPDICYQFQKTKNTWLEFDNSRIWFGIQPINGKIDCEIYCSAQLGWGQKDNQTRYLILNYVTMYPGNGPQGLAVWPHRADSCKDRCTAGVIHDVGSHEGDIEQVNVICDLKLEKVIAVNFNAHGRDQFVLDPPLEGTRPLVAVACCGHGTRPKMKEDIHLWWIDREDHSIPIAGHVAAVDICQNGGAVWDPINKIIIFGKDEKGEFFGPQWIPYKGRLGTKAGKRNKVKCAEVYKSGKGNVFHAVAKAWRILPTNVNLLSTDTYDATAGIADKEYLFPPVRDKNGWDVLDNLSKDI